MKGMVVFDYADRYAEGVARDGRVAGGGPAACRAEDVVSGGVEAFPETLLKLFRGENFGKLVLQVADA